MAEPPDKLRALVTDLLEQAQMPEADVRRRAELARDPHYWLTLAPAMTIGSVPRDRAQVFDAESVEAARRHFAAEGYFQVADVLDPALLSRLNAAIDGVVAAGWPAAFAWVYDEFWSLARVPEISALISSQLGAGHLQIPHIWVHVVPAMVGSSGWMPHFDGPIRGRASIWIALTDATLSNGCMHVVSRRYLAPTFESEPLATGRVAVTDAFRALQGVRALPVTRGSALGWTFEVLHWGGPCLSAGAPRRALSLEFLGSGHPPNADEVPLISLDSAFPSYSERIRMIAVAVQGYEKFEPGLVRYRALAKALQS